MCLIHQVTGTRGPRLYSCPYFDCNLYSKGALRRSYHVSTVDSQAPPPYLGQYVYIDSQIFKVAVNPYPNDIPEGRHFETRGEQDHTIIKSKYHDLISPKNNHIHDTLKFQNFA